MPDVEQHFQEVKKQLKELKFGYDFDLVNNVHSSLLEGKEDFILQMPFIMPLTDTKSHTYKFDLYFNKSNDNSLPTLDKYDISIETEQGESLTKAHKVRGKIEPLSVSQAIGDLTKSMTKSNGEKMYAYLKDEYGNVTDISHEIKPLSVRDFMDKNLKVLDVLEYQKEYILNISNTDYEGCLETNAIYIKCSNTNISSIKAPKADEIECCNCENLESIQALQCMKIIAENTPLLVEENIEANPHYCSIEGVEEMKNPIKFKIHK